ncbi:MAG: LacI family transcriptional regulator [Clostridia bacterium]|nr:LacI family transcriptional regulator [Clostridia bacterium]
MITRTDVAKHAGVSKTLVSRVLNNSGYVSTENRKKVEAAIKELGYTPNLIARSLKTRKTHQILFYARELSNPFFTEVYEGMEDYAEKLGYTIVVSSHFNPQMIAQRQFDGIILSHIPPNFTEELLKLGVPTVVTDYSGKALPFPSVGIDIESGTVQAIHYLSSQGHAHIAFLANSPDPADLRYQGFVKGLSECCPMLNPENLIFTANSPTYYHRGYDAAKQLKKNLSISAVFTFNDAMAIGAMAALSEEGIPIPEAVSIIGFDNILQAEFTAPPLTTVSIPKYDQGWESAKMLLKIIQGEKVQPITLETQLILRNSVKKVNTVAGNQILC